MGSIKLNSIEKWFDELQVIKGIDLELEINYEKTISEVNFFESYHEKKRELSKNMENWERLVEEIENLKQY